MEASGAGTRRRRVYSRCLQARQIVIVRHEIEGALPYKGGEDGESRISPVGLCW